MLSLFLRASGPLPPRAALAEDARGRALCKVPCAMLGREPVVVGRDEVFVGLPMFCRLDANLDSILLLRFNGFL